MKIKRFIGGMLESNGYIVYSAKAADDQPSEAFIIDPGYNPKKFVKYVNDNNLTVKGIILTHHHYDHVGGADRIRKELDCPVMIHSQDADMMVKDVDTFLYDGDVLKLNENQGELEEKLVVINTPGHTHGGICLMDSRGKVCFTGDTIFNVDLGRTDLEDGDESEMIASMRNIVNKWSNDITIYPGHGDSATMKTVRKINQEFLDIVGDK